MLPPSHAEGLLGGEASREQPALSPRGAATPSCRVHPVCAVPTRGATPSCRVLLVLAFAAE